jgi:hypothetical protein
MNFLQKKIWIAWSKLRFLRLPVDKRVRLEVTTDGRHITFLLVSLSEAGYGVQVMGSPAVFRELICLRKSAPIPFVVGGKEYEVGISISDEKHSPLATRDSSLILLDYDYFSGLNNAGVSHGGTANTEEGEDLGKNESSENFNHNRARGQVRERATEGWPVGRESGSERVKLHEYARIYTDGQQGDAQGTCAGDAFSNPFTSELARDAETTSPTRSANDPALVYRAGELGSDGGSQPADSVEFLEGQSQAGLQMDNQKSPTIRTANDLTAPGEYSSSMLIREIRGQNASSPATSHSPLVTAPEALRAPYFMHPSVYHRGLHKRRSLAPPLNTRHSPPVTSYSPQRRRRFRIGFFGTHDREFYTKHYHFPGMNRFEILEAFLQKYGNLMTHLRGFPRHWDPCEIAVSIDERGGDRRGKTFLSQDHYLEALCECDFVLSPPGICTPLSHNLIEAMFCGAIPITNAGLFMSEPLADGRNCLEFSNAAGFSDAMENAFAITDSKLLELRLAAFDYYRRFLNPVAFANSLEMFGQGQLLVNAEEKSVPFVYPRFIWPPQ